MIFEVIYLKIRKGDVVVRKSYNKDILFNVDRILRMSNGESLAILKGLTKRIEVDSPISDLETVNRSRVNKER